MKNFALYILCILSFSLASCVKNYDPGLSEHTSKLVLNSVFSPESVFTASISHSQSTIDSTDIQSLPGVKIELFEDGQKIEELSLTSEVDTITVYNFPEGETEEIIESHVYRSTVKPQSGKSYSITASKDGYETINAYSEVPPQLSTPIIYTDDLQIETTGYGGQEITGNIWVDIDDVPNEENFYEFHLYRVFKDSIYDIEIVNGIPNITFTGEVDISRNRIYTNVSDGSGNGTVNDELEFGPEISQYSDVTFDGQRKRFILSDINEYINGAGHIELEIRSLSKDHYNYSTSWEKHYFNQGNFLAEPVIVYNNIENGYGIFAGYSTTILPIEF